MFKCQRRLVLALVPPVCSQNIFITGPTGQAWGLGKGTWAPVTVWPVAWYCLWPDLAGPQEDYLSCEVSCWTSCAEERSRMQLCRFCGRCIVIFLITKISIYVYCPWTIPYFVPLYILAWSQTSSGSNKCVCEKSENVFEAESWKTWKMEEMT